MLFRPARYGQQPPGEARVDGGSPLSQYLTSIYIPGRDGGHFSWDRKGSGYLIAAGSPFTSWRIQGRFYADNNSGNLNNTIPGISTFPICMVAAGYFNNGSNNWTFCSLNTSGGGGSSRCDIVLTSSTEIDYIIRNNFGTIATVAGTGLTGVTSGAFYVCVAQSLSATDHQLFINGTKYTSATNMGGITSAYNAFIVGGQGTGGAPGAKLDGGVLFAAYGRAVIPDSLALEVSRDPSVFWKMFPRNGPSYFDVPAAGGNTLTAPLGTLTLGGLVPVFNQSVSLVAPIGTMTLQELLPTFQQGNSIVTPLGTLVLGGLVPTFVQPQSIVAPLGTLTLGGLVPAFQQGQSIVAPLGTLTLGGLLPAFNQNESIVVPLGILTLQGLDATFQQSGAPIPPVSGGGGFAQGGGKREVESLVESLPLFKKLGKKPTRKQIEDAIADLPEATRIAVSLEIQRQEDEDDAVVLLILRGLV